MEPIKVQMTWAGVTPILIAALEDGTDAGKQVAREELLRLASLYDRACEAMEQLETAARDLATICVAGGMEGEAVDAVLAMVGEAEA